MRGDTDGILETGRWFPNRSIRTQKRKKNCEVPFNFILFERYGAFNLVPMQHWFGHYWDGHIHVLNQVEGGAFRTTLSSGLTSGPPSLTLSTGIKRFPCRVRYLPPFTISSEDTKMSLSPTYSTVPITRSSEHLCLQRHSRRRHSTSYRALKGNRIVSTKKPHTREDNVKLMRKMRYLSLN